LALEYLHIDIPGPDINIITSIYATYHLSLGYVY